MRNKQSYHQDLFKHQGQCECLVVETNTSHHPDHDHITLLLGRENLGARRNGTSGTSLFAQVVMWWLVIYGATGFCLFQAHQWQGLLPDACIPLGSLTLPGSIPQQGPAWPQGFTLLLLHGGEILKGERAHGGSPECVSLHDGFQSGSAEREASNRTGT